MKEKIYCEGSLLDAVQRSNIFPDCKHFVDMPLRLDAGMWAIFWFCDIVYWFLESFGMFFGVAGSLSRCDNSRFDMFCREICHLFLDVFNGLASP